ncbi:MAG: response regulator [Bacillota bacterium]
MYRAVIVDDEPFMLEGMRMMINWQRCGFTLCGEAKNAQDALHLVDTLQPHLLITDVRMPGILGTDLSAIISRYHPRVLVLFFSGYRDFSYAQSAIRSHAFGYLVKPIDPEEVESTLLRVKAELDTRQAVSQRQSDPTPLLRDQALSRITCGDASPETLLRAGVLLQLRGDDPCYCAVLSHQTSAIPEHIRLILSSAGGTLFELSPKEYGLVFRHVERDVQLLERLIAPLPNREPYTLSIGGVYSGVQGFQKSLMEALDAQGVLYETVSAVRVYKPFDAQTAAWLGQANLPALRHALTSDRSDALDAEIAALTHAAAHTQPNLFALRCMAATLDAMLPVAGADMRASLGHPLWHQNAAERDGWLQAFYDQLRALRRALMPEAGKSLPAPVQATVAAIRGRYAEPLNLSQIANDLHMNAVYLGQLFKKHTGATFHRQLLMTRIEHACVLLRQTASPITEIAISVGFRDVDYFSQQFRNRMGMSPVAYRHAVSTEEEPHAPHQ